MNRAVRDNLKGTYGVIGGVGGAVEAFGTRLSSPITHTVEFRRALSTRGLVLWNREMFASAMVTI